MSTKPRVIMAGPAPPSVGGMVTVIADLAGSSLAERLDLELFDTGKRTPPGRSFTEAIVFRLRLWMRWWAILGGPTPVIAHIHTCSGLSYFLDAMLLALARLRGAPVVLHIHGGAFDRFLDALSTPARYLARAAARHADRVVVLSEQWRARLEPRLPGAAMRVIENGVPLAAEHDFDQEPGADRIILFLGNLSVAKGVCELVDAAQDLPAGWRVVLLGGEGEAGMTERLRGRIRQAGLSERVALAGTAVGAAKQDWLDRADIFVLPSHVEGLPVSMLEAMSAGLPVVVTPVGAVPSVVRDGDEGLIVPVGDSRKLHEALSRLASDAALRRRLGAAARRRVIEHYSIEQRVPDYLSVYRELMPAMQSGGLCIR